MVFNLAETKMLSYLFKTDIIYVITILRSSELLTSSAIH